MDSPENIMRELEGEQVTEEKKYLVVRFRKITSKSKEIDVADVRGPYTKEGAIRDMGDEARQWPESQFGIAKVELIARVKMSLEVHEVK